MAVQYVCHIWLSNMAQVHDKLYKIGWVQIYHNYIEKDLMHDAAVTEAVFGLSCHERVKLYVFLT